MDGVKQMCVSRCECVRVRVRATFHFLCLQTLLVTTLTNKHHGCKWEWERNMDTRGKKKPKKNNENWL